MNTDQKARRWGASLRARRRGEPKSAGWQAAASRGLRALPGSGRLQAKSQMSTDKERKAEKRESGNKAETQIAQIFTNWAGKF